MLFLILHFLLDSKRIFPKLKDLRRRYSITTLGVYMYIWYIHFFVYIIYTKNCIYILLYIQLYIQYIYTVYEIWKWAVYMYIYSVYEILRFCIYTCIYTTLSIAKLTCSNIVRLRFLKSILIVYLYIWYIQFLYI